ncbi:MAG: polysaccharide deacetylase family protein [Bacteroidetes bacterium HGW-Bacteroidetes-17]|jgi:peptidoglycan/xylan/chitin deacetylase (PgdA/CDA1 family)|nr:MAG: polysaccharide deacetylase family protein [Bacteroidetes bacterium HGW-Bacteroidetes-17]
MPDYDKKIYLTFDDGPTPDVTDALLDILKNYGAKATFFCLGKNVLENKSLFDEIRKEGHQIGNHTWDHLNSKKVGTGEYINSISKTKELINSKLFRPPYGRITKEQANLISNNFKIVMWSVLSRDFDLNQSKEKCLSTVLKHTKAGSIIVFHDSMKASIQMLYTVPKVLDYYQKKGFEFSAINDELV